MRLSVQAANKFYNTYVYCDTASAKLFRLNQIPFSKIISVDWLDKYDFPNWGLAKLETMLNQTEPYIHIDLDTIITKELNIPTTDISWGYAEVDFNSSINEDKLSHHLIDYVYNNYLKIAKKYEDCSKFDYLKIVNASLIIVKKPYPIRDVITELHSRIVLYRNILSSKINMFIEQFLFYQLIKDKGHIEHSIISNSNYNDLTLFWINEIKHDESVMDNFYNNRFIHIPQMDKFTDDDFDFIYSYLIEKLDLDDIREIRIVNPSESLI
jgi:hypothetical protein